MASVPSPRSVTTKASMEEGSEDEMECDEELVATPEMPSFLPSLIIEALGYPAGLGTCVARLCVGGCVWGGVGRSSIPFKFCLGVRRERGARA